MRNNNVMGILFPNMHDEALSALTSSRPFGSVPFGGRYRLIDFTLSNLVNAGISKVGLFQVFLLGIIMSYHSHIDNLIHPFPLD